MEEKVIQIKSGIMNDICWCQCRKHHICEKEYIRNPDKCICKNGRYFVSIIDDSIIKCDEILEETKTIPTILNAKI